MNKLVSTNSSNLLLSLRRELITALSDCCIQSYWQLAWHWLRSAGNMLPVWSASITDGGPPRLSAFNSPVTALSQSLLMSGEDRQLNIGSTHTHKQKHTPVHLVSMGQSQWHHAQGLVTLLPVIYLFFSCITQMSNIYWQGLALHFFPFCCWF